MNTNSSLDIEYIIYRSIYTGRFGKKDKYFTIYFKIKSSDFELDENFIIRSFVSKTDKYYDYIHRIDNFISDINNDKDSELLLIINKSTGMDMYSGSESELCLKEGKELLFFPNRKPYTNCIRRYSLKYSNNYITINDKTTVYNSNNCIIELLEFVKKMAFAPCNKDYINDISNINLNKIFFDMLSIKNLIQMYYGFNEIPLEEYRNLYNTFESSINNQYTKYYPIYYTDEVWAIKLIENLDNRRSDLPNETKIKYLKYYMVLQTFKPFHEVRIVFIPDKILDVIKQLKIIYFI